MGKNDETGILIFLKEQLALGSPCWDEWRAKLSSAWTCRLPCAVLLPCSSLCFLKLTPLFTIPVTAFLKDENMFIQHSLHHSVSNLHSLFCAFQFLLHSVAEGGLPSHFKAMVFSGNCTGKNENGLWGTRIQLVRRHYWVISNSNAFFHTGVWQDWK